MATMTTADFADETQAQAETQTRRDPEKFKGGFGRGAFRAARAAAYLDVSRDTFDRWNAGGKVPRPVRIGGVNLWPRVDLDGWIAAGMPRSVRMGGDPSRGKEIDGRLPLPAAALRPNPRAASCHSSGVFE